MGYRWEDLGGWEDCRRRGQCCGFWFGFGFWSLDCDVVEEGLTSSPQVHTYKGENLGSLLIISSIMQRTWVLALLLVIACSLCASALSMEVLGVPGRLEGRAWWAPGA